MTPDAEHALEVRNREGAHVAAVCGCRAWTVVLGRRELQPFTSWDEVEAHLKAAHAAHLSGLERRRELSRPLDAAFYG